MQPGPRDVSASAPDGTESSWSCTVGGVDLKASKENDEQPARVNPVAAIAMPRRMINPPPIAAISHNPARTIGASGEPGNRAGLHR